MNKVGTRISITLLAGVVILPLADMCKQAYDKVKASSPVVLKQQASLSKLPSFVPKLDVPLDGNDLGPSDLPPQRATEPSSKTSTDTVSGLIPGDDSTGKKCPVLRSDEVPAPKEMSKPKDRRAIAKIVNFTERPSIDDQMKSTRTPHA